jgi:hypothetical protein
MAYDTQNQWIYGLLSIVKNSKYYKTQRFANWNFFILQTRGRILILCWVP